MLQPGDYTLQLPTDDYNYYRLLGPGASNLTLHVTANNSEFGTFQCPYASLAAARTAGDVCADWLHQGALLSQTATRAPVCTCWLELAPPKNAVSGPRVPDCNSGYHPLAG